MSASVRHRELAAALELVGSQAARSIKARRRQAAWNRALDQVLLPILVALPTTLVTTYSGLLEHPTSPVLVLVVLAFPLLHVCFRVLWAHLEAVDPRDALAVLDRKLGLEDRLLTAREFLASATTSPFMEAALDDAAAVVARAQDVHLALPKRNWSPRVSTPELLSALAASVAFLMWLQWSGPIEHSIEASEATPDEELALLPAEPRREDPAMILATEEEPRREAEPLATPQEAFPSEAERRDRPGTLTEGAKESSGKTGEGRSSDAEASSSASESRGQPSNQSQVSKPSEKAEKKAAPKKAAKPPEELRTRPRKNDEDDSGSTAGKGSSKGSSKNPAASKWSSKDQVTHQDDQEIEEDEDTEDEEEDQESRGGIQPNLRDRKPPVSRDLRIGFGNQKNPDANSRGGPSEAKKSRGTASLVLGVPVPDRVKGQPSPGKTKITQERIEPRPEDDAAINARARVERPNPTGYLEERELTPWMRTLVRQYFLALRDKRN